MIRPTMTATHVIRRLFCHVSIDSTDSVDWIGVFMGRRDAMSTPYLLIMPSEMASSLFPSCLDIASILPFNWLVMYRCSSFVWNVVRAISFSPSTMSMSLICWSCIFCVSSLLLDAMAAMMASCDVSSRLILAYSSRATMPPKTAMIPPMALNTLKIQSAVVSLTDDSLWHYAFFSVPIFMKEPYQTHQVFSICFNCGKLWIWRVVVKKLKNRC